MNAERQSNDDSARYQACILHSFPVHSQARCLAAKDNSVLIGFEDGSIAEWAYLTGQYLLRPFHSKATCGLCFGSDNGAYAVFEDTTVLAWDRASGNSLCRINHNAIERERHAEAVAEVIEKTGADDYIDSASDAYLLDSSPTCHSVNRIYGEMNDSLLYSLETPGIDSWGTWVMSFFTLHLWDGRNGNLETLHENSLDEQYVGIVPEANGRALVIATSRYVYHINRIEMEEQYISHDREIVNLFGMKTGNAVIVVSDSDIYLLNVPSLLRADTLYSSPTSHICEAVISGDRSLLLFRNNQGEWHVLSLTARKSKPIKFPHSVDMITAIPDESNKFLVVFTNRTATVVSICPEITDDIPF
jgi:hypothetical protein